MLAKDVRIGEVYLVRVSGRLQEVQVTYQSPHGGWIGKNLATGRSVRIRTARRLRRLAKTESRPYGGCVWPPPDGNPGRALPVEGRITYRHRPADAFILWSNVFMPRAAAIAAAQSLLSELIEEGFPRAQVRITWSSGKIQRVRLPQ